MEHFEVHMEKLQDVLVEIQKEGSSVLENLPEQKVKKGIITQDEMAMIDEISGLTDYIEMVWRSTNIPEGIQNELRSNVTPYTPGVDKAKVRYQLYEKIYGGR